MDTTPNLVTCDWCKCQVSKKKIDEHKVSSCPKAPAEIIAARPKRPNQKFNYYSWWRSLEQMITARSGSPSTRHRFEVDPTPNTLPTTPSIQDRQINPKAIVTRLENGVFKVNDVLSSGGEWHHPLRMECKYCHRTIEVNANGPSDMPQFAKDEACRLALLEHWRLDDARPHHSPVRPTSA
jgi:hypothetical protein